MDPRKFFAELKRRNVYRAAVGYTALAWLAIQVATQILPVFEVPAWSVRLIIVLLAAGFPLALLFAWAFELTPTGIVRTEEVAENQPGYRALGRKIDFAIIGVLALAVAVLLFDRFGSDGPSRRGIPDKSIAVLPFENLSAEKENAFFADGIQDDILTSLAKIRDLKVTSRTSVRGYRGSGARDLREIGKLLGVAHILEGSVRRDGQRVKVTVQLIDARDDHHVWAENYDRTISDALTLQGELAREIATALKATLSPEEKVTVGRRPTDNPEAYVLYLRARQLEIDPDTLLQDFKAAVQLDQGAIKLDPAFALAHARLAATMARIYHFYEPTENWKEGAQFRARESLRLQPDLGEGHYAVGLCYYWLDNAYERALQEIEIAAGLLPNDSEIGLIIAAIARRQGRWDEALAHFQRAEALDPQNPNVARNIIYTYGALTKWPEAVQAAERLRALAPDSINAGVQLGYLQFLSRGDPRPLEQFLASVASGTDPEGSVTTARWDLCMIKRDFPGAAAVLAASPLNEFSYLNGLQSPKAYFVGCTALAQGDAAGARAAFEAARPSFEEAVREAPESAQRRANLGLLYGFLGRKEDAIREGRRAVELKPESQDALDGPLMSCCLALIYARVGEQELALPLLERLLRMPGTSDTVQYSVTRQDLRFRWEWDPLRNDPRFGKLIGP